LQPLWEESKMTLMLSDHEVGILLNGTSMNSGYPFFFGQRYVPDAGEQEIINSIIERFRGVRRENHERRMLLPRHLELAPLEAGVLIAILEACLTGCRGNNIPIHLHLHAEDENEVRRLMERLRTLKAEADDEML